jgi:hypothetical protein
MSHSHIPISPHSSASFKRRSLFRNASSVGICSDMSTEVQAISYMQPDAGQEIHSTVPEDAIIKI